MKKIFLMLLMLIVITGCKQTPVETIGEENYQELVGTTVKVGMLKGPTGMGMAKLIDDSENGETINDYNFTIESDATVLNQMLIKGELDIASIPTNAVSILNNKTDGEILYIAVNTTGNLYVLTHDVNVKTLSDLKGMNVVSSGAAANPEYIMNMLLKKSGLSDEINYVANEGTDHAASLAEFMAGKYDAVMLPEPFVTKALEKDPTLLKSINVTDEFEKAFNTPIVLGSVAVRKTFALENEDALVLFLNDLENSINYCNESYTDAAALCGKFDIIDQSVAEKAIPNAGITFIKGDDMVNAVGNFLALLYEEAPSAIGGEVHTDHLYYTID